MKTILLFSFLLISRAGNSQVVIDVDKASDNFLHKSVYTTGFPVVDAKYVRMVSGTPYFSEIWMKGSILINDSIAFNEMLLRLDLLEGSFIYLSEKKEEMTSVQPVKAVSLLDTTTGKKYLFVHSSYIAGTTPGEKGWYQLLTGEKLTLFKQYFKRMVESKAYGSSVTEQSIETEQRYFIAVNKSFIRLKSPGDIAKLVTNNKQALEDYIEKNKLKGKNEADYIAAVKFYDSLK
ncbi:MAG: hypothetical protein ABI688_01215 [Bacteroidota bacterium]